MSIRTGASRTWSQFASDLLQLWGAHLQHLHRQQRRFDAAQQKNSAHSIWWYVMLLVLVAAVAESIIASRYLGTQREEA